MSSGPEPLRPEAFRDLLQKNLAAFELTLDDAKTSRLARFLSELDRWRRTTNLTGRLSGPDLVSHALESAFASHLLPALGTGVDIGTGGGFPGVPLAVCRPDLRWVWVEPRQRRAAFLRHVARTVPMENAEVVSDRLEELARDGFDFVTSRGLKLDGAAVAGVLRPGGSHFLWTTKEDATETALSSARLRLEQTLPIPTTRRRVIAVFHRD